MNDWIIPDWPAPVRVKSLFTTRNGGVSGSAGKVYASMNLGAHVNDNPADVAHNRALLSAHLPMQPQWLKQVHGIEPVRMEYPSAVILEGDAAYCRQPGSVCAIMVADCLPVFLCDTAGTVVAVAHAGWRGLAGGVIERTVAAMDTARGNLIAWLGPAIGPEYFEVGSDVYDAFVRHDPAAEEAFTAIDRMHEKKWLADIFLLARQRLAENGVTAIYGGGICTYSDPQRFYSYRRDGETGRMAALIWLER